MDIYEFINKILSPNILALLTYLNSPYLVASFQKLFGVEIRFQKIATSNINNNNKKNENLKRLIVKTDHSHILANTIIHNKFWYYFFQFGAHMGNEIFCCLIFSFWYCE
jgi:hypothetical protein